MSKILLKNSEQTKLKKINFRFHKNDLQLLGDYGFGAHKQFANEAKMAVRLANFISAFLQVIDFSF